MSNFDAMDEYLAKGWQPLPLPPRKKRFPPTGYTGRTGKRVEQQDIWVWRNEFPKDLNVALRLTECEVQRDNELFPEPYQVIGIDVDNYGVKVGGKELHHLEEKLGPLPKTIVSTARTDGTSGIRLFLAPSGLAFKGKPGGHDVGFDCQCIEVIQHKHRFMVAYPSVHPEGLPYLFYTPGQKLDGNGHKRIPPVSKLKMLPDAWVDHLTVGRSLENLGSVDLDSTDDDVLQWFQNVMDTHGPGMEAPANGLCRGLQDELDGWLKRVEDPTDSHTPLHMGHFALINLAYEGHAGISLALELFNKAWLVTVLKEGKRSQADAQSEIKRSFVGALRVLKGQVDDDVVTHGSKSYVVQGFTKLAQEMCSDAEDWAEDGNPVSRLIGPDGNLVAVPDKRTRKSDVGKPWNAVPLNDVDIDLYDRSEIGMAQVFIDRVGDNALWIKGAWWIVYDGMQWNAGELGDQHLARGLFVRAVIDPLKALALQKYNELQTYILPVSQGGGGGQADDPVAKAIEKKANEYQKSVIGFGTKQKIDACLALASGSLSINANKVDANPHLLGLPEGKVLELLPRASGLDSDRLTNMESEGYRVREGDKADIITRFLPLPFLSTEQLVAGEGGPEGERAIELWNGYLDTFLPNPEARKDIQKALGYSLLGHNEEKLILVLFGPSHTGKSTMLNCLDAALGGYLATVNAGVAFPTQTPANNPQLIGLIGKRIAVCSELDGVNLGERILKALSGGDTERVTAKGSNVLVDVYPSFTFVFAANRSPNIRNIGNALKRRMMGLPFTTAVQPDRDVKNADKRLPALTAPAVLAWLADGYKMFVHEGIERDSWSVETKMSSAKLSSAADEVIMVIDEIVECADDKLLHTLSKPGIWKEIELVDEWCSITVHDLWQRVCTLAYDNQPPRGLTRITFERKVSDFYGVEVQKSRVRNETRDKKVFVGLKFRGPSEVKVVKA